MQNDFYKKLINIKKILFPFIQNTVLYVEGKCYLCKLKFGMKILSKKICMKINLKFLIIAFTTIAAFTSCHKSLPKQTLYIPKDATFILGADPKSLSDKLADSHIDMDSLFKTFGDTSEAAQVGIKNWNDVKNSGVDWQSEFFVFATTSGSIMNGQSTSTGVVAAMKDVSAFEAFLKKSYTSIDIKKADNYSYAALKDGFAVGWNSDVAILANVIGNAPDDTTSNSNNGAASQKELAALFAQKEDGSVASLPDFKDLVTKKADMLFWTNSSGTLSSIPLIGMTKASDLLKDSYTAGTINFEDGKATLQAKSFSNKDMQNILSKYAGPTVNMDMVERYPSQVEGYTVFSFNPQIINAVAKYVGVDATANQFLQQVGLSLDDILNAFKGNFGVIFSDFGMSARPNEFSPGDSIKMPTAKLVINAEIGDKKSYDKVTAALASKGLMVNQNGQYVFSQMGNFAMSTDDKNLIIASDANLLQEYKTGSTGKANVPSEIENKSKGTAIALYIDVNSILKSIPSSSPESQAVLASAQQTFKDVLGTSSNYDGKGVEQYLQLRTMNDKENSLASFIKFATQAAKQETAKENDAQFSSPSTKDSSTQ